MSELGAELSLSHTLTPLFDPGERFPEEKLRHGGQ